MDKIIDFRTVKGIKFPLKTDVKEMTLERQKELAELANKFRDALKAG